MSSGRLSAFTFTMTKDGRASAFTFYAGREVAALAMAEAWAAKRGWEICDHRPATSVREDERAQRR